MDIYKILLEAEDDTEPKEETIKIEADEEDSSFTDDAETEVAEAEEEEVETEEDDSSEESDDTTDEETTDEEGTDNTEDETSFTDEAEDSISDDTSDDSSDTESTDDSSSEESADGETKEEPSELIKKDALLKDFINLYENINLVMDKLDKIPISDMLINRVVIQVRKNFSKMAEYIYDIITRLYKVHNYIKNLYVYNYFIESYRINVEMLKKINVFTLNA